MYHFAEWPESNSYDDGRLCDGLGQDLVLCSDNFKCKIGFCIPIKSLADGANFS